MIVSSAYCHASSKEFSASSVSMKNVKMKIPSMLRLQILAAFRLDAVFRILAAILVATHAGCGYAGGRFNRQYEHRFGQKSIKHFAVLPKRPIGL